MIEIGSKVRAKYGPDDRPAGFVDRISHIGLSYAKVKFSDRNGDYRWFLLADLEVA